MGPMFLMKSNDVFYGIGGVKSASRDFTEMFVRLKPETSDATWKIEQYPEKSSKDA